MVYGLFGLLFADCIPGGPSPLDDSGDTAISCPLYSGDTYLAVEPENCSWPEYWDPVNAVNQYCDPTVRAFDVYTVGWSSGGVVQIADTGGTSGRVEEHPITTYDYDEQGWWENLYVELAIVDPSQVTEGTSSGFPCEIEPSVTFLLLILDLDGDLADCAVWGDDPESVEGACTNWN